MLKHLRRLSTETLHKNPWLEYRHDRYLHPDDSEGDFFYVQTPGAFPVAEPLRWVARRGNAGKTAAIIRQAPRSGRLDPLIGR